MRLLDDVLTAAIALEIVATIETEAGRPRGNVTVLEAGYPLVTFRPTRGGP